VRPVVDALFRDALDAAARLRATSLLVVDLDCAEHDSEHDTWRDGTLTVYRCGPHPGHQLHERASMAWIDRRVAAAPEETRRAALHQAAQYVAPGGAIAFAADVPGCGLVSLCETMLLAVDTANSTTGMVVFRRPERTTVHDVLHDARRRIVRVDSRRLASMLAGDAPPTVVDIRSHVDRGRTGVIESSIHVPRTVLEWHLDPVNGYPHPAVWSFEQPIVVVCNGGYSSSLAAESLLRIGFGNVADLIGGMFAWVDAGLPVIAPTHSHVDL
jgi:rhodanese-related sulfurtransferase